MFLKLANRYEYECWKLMMRWYLRLTRDYAGPLLSLVVALALPGFLLARARQVLLVLSLSNVET